MAHHVYPIEQPKTPWLAISWGCCASHRDSIDDDGRAELRANGETEMRICYDQPSIVPGPRVEPVNPRPTTSHSMSQHVSQWVASGRDFAARASSRASVHTVTRPRRSQSRPRIGGPTDFRRFDGLDGEDGMIEEPMPIRRRRSFSPLELSIYLPDGRLSPLPDFSQLEWEKHPADLVMPAQAVIRNRDSRTNSFSSNGSASHLIQRKPVGAHSRRSSVQSQTSIRSRPLSGTLSTLPFLQEEPKGRPDSSFSNAPTVTTIPRSSTPLSSPSRILSRMPSPNRSRSNTALSRPGSLRRAKTDIDDAIRELNTIVEERRASAYRSQTQSPALVNRPPPSPSHHVPAIAPALRMHVRSETLSDIGSAFSVPLTTKPLPIPPKSPARKLALSTTLERTFTGPLTSNPITPPTPTIPTPTTPIYRLGAWLKRSLPATPSTPAFFSAKSTPTTPKSIHSTSSTPFYQCEPPLPPTASRPTTSASGRSSGSRTFTHTRQPSDETATVTLFSTTDVNSIPTTPALSTRSLSPTSEPTLSNPPTPARINLLKGEGKTRKVPAPLVLAKESVVVERALGSARSIGSRKSLKPPPSPNYGLLAGMEIAVGGGGMGGAEMGLGGMLKRESVSPVSPVGIAF